MLRTSATLQISLLRPASAVAPVRLAGCSGRCSKSAVLSIQERRLLSAGPRQHLQRANIQPLWLCRANDPKERGMSAGGGLGGGFNSAYLAIFGVFGALFLFRNPYIFAALSIITILPQNSTVTSLNSMVLLFYESGLFMNFAEASHESSTPRLHICLLIDSTHYKIGSCCHITLDARLNGSSIKCMHALTSQAVTCVRLVTWLSIACCLVSFAVFQ